MEFIGQWLLVAAAIGIGWFIGYQQSRRGGTKTVDTRSGKYPKTLQYLFEAYDAPTLDSFLQELEVNRHTIQLHLSIANYYRRKGEIEKATAIHQNLLSHPEARLQHSSQLTFELAQDYMVAGLYDRAEALFIELSNERQWKQRCTESLLEIYEHEKDWDIARERALSLDVKRDRDLQRRIAQYCCELADRSIRRKDFAEARQFLKEALGHDKSCVRASLQMARVCIATEQFAEALNELKRIEQQDPVFLTEAVDLIVEICMVTQEQDKLVRILQRIWEQQPSAHVMMTLATQLGQDSDPQNAIEFLLQQLDEHPTLGGVKTLLELLTPFAETETKRWVQIIKGVLESLLEKNQDYCCINCGFSGRHMHWQCPSCKTWGNIKPIPWV
ncbi:lipopolysaccharide assembly protein LapB [Hahella sp. CCB-MM4]|uniref:lipopolysaccharide assembly protein LapB n=1 Tax=Hahella sp. (strain CCB-MM4) TaxID=1926491 RepID=UPI000B9A2DD4|nr:lipopolysaccharide assembly protein LapB [Hahella sp. CCB-MM4]OZG72061.1 lipopolysaccharide assembly protein LapB [Hahella sp. CCB-MM4]